MKDIIEKHYKKNFNRHVKRMTYPADNREDAEDIVQQAYTDALQYSGSFRLEEGEVREEKFERWFATILKNTLRRYMRNKAVGRDFVIELKDDMAETPTLNLHPDRFSKLLEDELKTWCRHSEQHEALDLLFFKNYPYSLVSQLTKYATKSLHTYVNEFRTFLRAKYPEESKV